MNQKILRALMQLFALIATPISRIEGRRIIVKSLLREQLNDELVEEYLSIYEQFINQYNKRKITANPDKFLSVNSVKLLTICTLLNEELIQQQKIIVLIKLLEFIRLGEVVPEQAYVFITTVSDIFRIPREEFDTIKNFIFTEDTEYINPDRILVINSRKKNIEKIKHLYSEGLKGEIYVLYVKLHNLLFFYFDAENEIYLNQQLLYPNRIYTFSLGGALRTSKITPIYYNDIISVFNYDKLKTKIIFEADRIEYRFRNGTIGTHSISFTEKSGNLIGIMGGSGSGKTTLLNLLNGNYNPTNGHIYINGIDLFENKNKLNGFIGYVAQDDLLIEDLTVFENVYYNAKLCLGEFSDFAIKRKIIELLKELGLYSIKDMKVGSVLHRKISGGQRKRLNIALELIRRPPILFLDEPTSGLSSRDSENIMDLLKKLTFNGRLVFIVIHQPSSAIFKMFDRLIVLDQGGYMIYNGQAVESILYFKSALRKANWNDTVCPVCGNINSEQIFDIIETRILDEYGNQTQTRKISPVEWRKKYLEHEKKQEQKKSYLVQKLPKISFNIPSKIAQFITYTKRDMLTKLSNPINIGINLLLTPILALVLTLLIKYWKVDSSLGYLVALNENIPVYIFMSVIVAVFVGLTISAQEIFKDRKILQHEAFLNLSRASYLASKLHNLFLMSAYQSLVFVLIGNAVMGISFMNIYYWVALLVVWYSSTFIGLIFSETVKNSTTIYIIIPFLVIPQIVLSGVLVPFNKLNPYVTKPNSIPVVCDFITARWAYEALAVKQFVDNPYMKNIYQYDKKISEADYVKDFWINELENKIVQYNKVKSDPKSVELTNNILELLNNEFNDRHVWTKVLKYNFDPESITPNLITDMEINNISLYLKKLKKYYITYRNKVNEKKNIYIKNVNNDSTQTKLSDKRLFYHNEKLEYFVTNSDQQRIVEYNNRLYRTMKPIFYEPESYLLKAHYYAPTKPFFGKQIDTFWFNISVLIVFIVFLYFILYYKILHKLVEAFNHFEKKQTKKTNSKFEKNIGRRKNKKTRFYRYMVRFK